MTSLNKPCCEKCSAGAYPCKNTYCDCHAICHQEKKCELTNGGKPHICGEPAIHDGTKEGVALCPNCDLPVDSATPKNSEWEERLEAFVRDVTSIPPMPKSKVRERLNLLLQERSKDTVAVRNGLMGTLVEKEDGLYVELSLEELIYRLGGRFYSLHQATKETGENEISDWWYAEGVVDNGENPIKADGSTPLEALKKLSEQLNQK